MTPQYGVNYTYDSYGPQHEHFSGLNVECPICAARIGAPCRDRAKGHTNIEMHRARRSRSKKMLRIIENEQEAMYTGWQGINVESLTRPDRAHSLWTAAFHQKWLVSLRKMHKAQMAYFKAKLVGKEPFSVTLSSMNLQNIPKNSKTVDEIKQKMIHGRHATTLVMDEITAWDAKVSASWAFDTKRYME